MELNTTLSICCLLSLFNRSKVLQIKVTLNAGGFCPGDTINVWMQVINQTDKNIREFQIKLTKVC